MQVSAVGHGCRLLDGEDDNMHGIGNHPDFEDFDEPADRQTDRRHATGRRPAMFFSDLAATRFVREYFFAFEEYTLDTVDTVDTVAIRTL